MNSIINNTLTHQASKSLLDYLTSQHHKDNLPVDIYKILTDLLLQDNATKSLDNQIQANDIDNLSDKIHNLQTKLNRVEYNQDSGIYNLGNVNLKTYKHLQKAVRHINKNDNIKVNNNVKLRLVGRGRGTRKSKYADQSYIRLSDSEYIAVYLHIDKV